MNLKERRVRLGYKQSELAEEFGVSQQYISAAERIDGYARAWYDLALKCLEYERRLEKLPRKHR